jgi:hypothetical protein
LDIKEKINKFLCSILDHKFTEISREIVYETLPKKQNVNKINYNFLLPGFRLYLVEKVCYRCRHHPQAEVEMDMLV